MIDRALFLKDVCIHYSYLTCLCWYISQAIIEFLEKPEYADISSKFDLGSAEWDALKAFSDILRVSN